MTPEVETHQAHHHTGHRWVDLSVAASALLISLCSVGISIHHGHTMEKLVAANSMPFLQFSNSNGEPRGNGVIASVLSYQVSNAGSGPARVEWFRMELDGQPFDNWSQVLKAGMSDLAKSGGDPTKIVVGTTTTSDIAPSFIKGGDTLTASRWERTDGNGPLWDVADKIRQSQRVRLKACYCSIFDECWIADSKVFKPQKVDRCE